MADRIFHITTREQWNHAALAGKYQADSLVTEGFIHCSTAAQLQSTGRRHFAGQTGLVVLEIDPGQLRWELRWEKSQGGGPRAGSAEHGEEGGRPPSEKGEDYPHLYGPLDLESVMSVQAFSA
jgi:uncharacterized protein (DUF952 family)